MKIDYLRSTIITTLDEVPSLLDTVIQETQKRLDGATVEVQQEQPKCKLYKLSNYVYTPYDITDFEKKTQNTYQDYDVVTVDKQPAGSMCAICMRQYCNIGPFIII